MGQPAEAREIVRHLLNISTPYSYTNPNFVLLCQGIEELTETFEADSDDVQYICETTKTTNIKGYTVGFDLSMGYIKGSKLQNWANNIINVPPVGSATACDYIRFNIDMPMYGTNNQFIGVRRRAAVQVNSVGGAATDSMTSELHFSATSDPELGYVTIDNTDPNNIKFIWTSAPLAAPVITSPSDGQSVENDPVMITGTGIAGANVEVYYGQDKKTPAVTVNNLGEWSTTIAANDMGPNAVIAAVQTLNGQSSVSSTPASFMVLSAISAPTITTPANNSTNIGLKPTISGIGYTGATVTVKEGENTILQTGVSTSGQWTGTSSTTLTAETEYTIKATQTLGTITSSESAEVKFTTQKLPTPVITSPLNNATDVSLTPTISGTGYPGAEVTVKAGENTIVTATVESNGTWTGTVTNALTESTSYTIKATQTLNGKASPESTQVQFTTVSQ